MKKTGRKSRTMMLKALSLMLACVLTFGVAAGATLAWLTDKTPAVKNTFTTSDVKIELTEEAGEGVAESSNEKQFQMIPGYTITKDPVVTVKADSEKCYLFVKLEKSDNFDEFMTYEMDNKCTDQCGEDCNGEMHVLWQKLTGVSDAENVYYRTVESSVADQTFKILKDDQVMVSSDVTKEMMNQLTEATYPTLHITAYACQFHKTNDGVFTAAEAWEQVPKQ